jgi:hypothetical protein
VTATAAGPNVTVLVRGIAVLVFAYGVVLAGFSHTGFPDAPRKESALPYLADKPLGEDGYYMLTVAWRLASTGTFTYNGDVPTTGVQPLVTMMAAALAVVVRGFNGDEWAFARAMLIAGVLQHLLLYWVLVTLSRSVALPDGRNRSTLALAAALVTLLNYSLFRISTYGLETPLYIALLMSAVAITVTTESWRPRDAIRLGLVCGLASLARIDFLLLLATFLALRLMRRAMSLRTASIIAAVAAAVAAPWFLWVISSTGHVMPSGGRAQGAFVTAAVVPWRLQIMAEAVAQQVSPWLYFPALSAALVVLGFASGVWIAKGAAAALGVALVARGWGQVRGAAQPVLRAWGIAVFCLIATYVLMFWSAHFYIRYSAPLLVLVLPLMVLGLRSWLQRRAVMMLAVLMVLASFGVTAFVTLHQGRVGNLHAVSTGFVRDRLPPPARIGAFQSGVLGYYNAHVFNLDGKVNAEALDAAGALNRYVADRSITHLLDWPEVIAGAFGEQFLASLKQCARQPPAGRSLCLEVPGLFLLEENPSKQRGDNAR